MKRPKFFPIDLLFWLVLLLTSGLCQAASQPLEEKPGADVFVTSRAALLRETASPNAKVIARLPVATRVTLLEGGDAYLHVEVPGDPAAVAPGGTRTGFLAAETTAVFDPGAPGTADMLTVGRMLARNPAFRTLGTALLARGVERLRQSGARMLEPRSRLLRPPRPWPQTADPSRRVFRSWSAAKLRKASRCFSIRETPSSAFSI